MHPRASPSQKRGERNIYCPYYRECLDFAVMHSWRFWNCKNCPHKDVQNAFEECAITLNHSVTFYELPLHVEKHIS